jgi:hypothetical protein
MLAPVCAARWTVGIPESRVVVERASNGLARATEPAARTIAAMDDESMPREEQKRRAESTLTPETRIFAPASGGVAELPE